MNFKCLDCDGQLRAIQKPEVQCIQCGTNFLINARTDELIRKFPYHRTIDFIRYVALIHEERGYQLQNCCQNRLKFSGVGNK